MPPAIPPRRAAAADDPADEALWTQFTRRIRPLRDRDAAPPPPPPPAPAPAGAPAAAVAAKRPPPRPQPAAALAVGDPPGGLDRASWTRLRTGRRAPERTLDLHGKTAERAHQALRAFLPAAQADGVRCVEIVTGRGSGEGGGVLKRELPHWLNLPPLRGLVLAATYPHPANQGAVRLLLRRVRPAG
jgi:DNA-nicking Smr family endonuclease